MTGGRGTIIFDPLAQSRLGVVHIPSPRNKTQSSSSGRSPSGSPCTKPGPRSTPYVGTAESPEANQEDMHSYCAPG